MKKFLPYLILAAMAAVSALAADWTGYIVDKNCSGKKGMWTNEACAKKCLDGGAPAVFVSEDGKVYNVANQDKGKAHGGHKVTVTGKMEGDTITVEDVKMQ